MAIGNAAAKAPAAASKPARVSMNPGVFTSSGIIDDIDVEITDAQTYMFDYAGTAVPSPALAIEFTDVNGVQHVQSYTVGKTEDWQPEESGEGFIAVSGKTAINNSTNLGKFLESMVKAGFPAERLDDGNLKVIIGTKVHVLQEVQEQRKGLIRTGKNVEKALTLLLVSKVISLPGEGTATAKAAAPASKAAVGGKANGGAKATVPATTAPAAAADDLDDELAGILVGALSSGEWFNASTREMVSHDPGTPMLVKEIGPHVFHMLKDVAGKGSSVYNAGVLRAGKQDFRAGLASVGIQYDGSQLTLAE